MTSLHYNKSRYYREMFIYNYLGGDGKTVDAFIVDKDHENGKEIHCITDHGVIIVYNLRTRKMVTKLIARPQQIKRYYINTNRQPSKKLLELCREHQRMGFNEF